MQDSVKFIPYNQYSKGHIDIINRLNSDELSKKYLGSNLYNNIEYILRRNEEDVRNEFYIISYHNIFVGIISLTNRSKDDEQFEIDIGILPEYRKKGIAEKVSNIFIDYVFNNIESIDKLYFKIDYGNEASVRLAEKQGLELSDRNGSTFIYTKSREKMKDAISNKK